MQIKCAQFQSPGTEVNSAQIYVGIAESNTPIVYHVRKGLVLSESLTEEQWVRPNLEVRVISISQSCVVS